MSGHATRVEDRGRGDAWYPPAVRDSLFLPLVYSSAWVSAAATALAAAAALAMRSHPHPSTLLLVFCGTLVIYNVDRLRDLERDRTTSPLRSAFVTAHRGELIGLAAAAAVASIPLGLLAGTGAIALLAPVLAAGLLHRRLKRFGWWKPWYVSGAWTAVVVGLPAVVATAPEHVAWIAALVGTTLAANVIASNLRDDEAVSARFGRRAPLHIASGCALLSTGIALAAPPALRPLLLLPLLTLASLVRFHKGELYGLVVVDGALLLGALLALPLLA